MGRQKLQKQKFKTFICTSMTINIKSKAMNHKNLNYIYETKEMVIINNQDS